MASPSLHSLLALSLIFISLPLSTSQPCNSYKFQNQKTFIACNDLSFLSPSLYWSYHPSSSKVDLAFKKSGVTSNTWIAWAINPTSTGMVGSQALIAAQQQDGTVLAYTSQITSYNTQLQNDNLSFVVYDISASYDNNNMIIFASIQLPSNTTVVNHVWQEGSMAGNVPGIHSLSGDNVRSFGKIDFLSGRVEAGKGDSRDTWKNVHGIINTISWGILMPIGAIVARYVKLYNDPGWFYIHVGCQSTGYLIGIIGWATGMWLGAKSSGVQYKGHKCIGLTLFCMATCQVLVGGFLRPKKDSKYRIYWNLFHYLFGYGTIALGITNVYKGLEILKPGKIWIDAYTGVIVCLGCIAVVLEVWTSYDAWKRRRVSSDLKEEVQSSGDNFV
ncbi:hypothetical protein UlMin_003687 [Ulmus minor]